MSKSTKHFNSRDKKVKPNQPDKAKIQTTSTKSKYRGMQKPE